MNLTPDKNLSNKLFAIDAANRQTAARKAEDVASLKYDIVKNFQAFNIHASSTDWDAKSALPNANIRAGKWSFIIDPSTTLAEFFPSLLTPIIAAEDSPIGPDSYVAIIALKESEKMKVKAKTRDIRENGKATIVRVWDGVQDELLVEATKKSLDPKIKEILEKYHQANDIQIKR